MILSIILCSTIVFVHKKQKCAGQILHFVLYKRECRVASVRLNISRGAAGDVGRQAGCRCGVLATVEKRHIIVLLAFVFFALLAAAFFAWLHRSIALQHSTAQYSFAR